MSKKSLVIVESPAKVKTIGKFLSNDFVVSSSGGHILDLPRRKMGVDLEHDFTPEYVVITAKKKILSDLKKEAKDKEKIYIATDPDREGEAIGWHLKEKLTEKKNQKKFLRVLFDEITAGAIKDAFSHPGELDLNKYNAQQARRVLDRIVGYLLSPLLWRKIAGGLSAGRVQSVALRLIVERERQIQAFTPQEYWEIEAELAKKEKGAKPFLARLEKIAEVKAEIKNQSDAENFASEIKKEQFIVGDVKETTKRKHPFAPFTTSSLQQEAFNKLRYNTRRTMMIAQTLYEGVELGKAGPVGLITYMRTDSVRISDTALTQVRQFITQNFGQKYLPEAPNFYKSKGRTQEAHEAIRPTLASRTPDSIKEYLTGEQYKLYALIWRRFVASQMKPAEILVTSVDINAGRFLFRASGFKLLFDGFSIIYNENEEDSQKYLPALTKDEVLNLIKLLPAQHFTKPPPRFTEASLVKILDEEGIGRPSTYVPIIQTIIYRDYVLWLKGALIPTELGMKVCDLLTENFPKIMDIQFTALMEDELDRIEEGDMSTTQVLKEFYEPFRQALEQAQNNIKKEVIETKEVCSVCGKPMVIKWGRFGKFLSCSDFPKCRNAKAITTGVKCPQNCGGELIERAFRGRIFYGCSNYPKCKFTTRTLPQQENKAPQNPV